MPFSLPPPVCRPFAAALTAVATALFGLPVSDQTGLRSGMLGGAG